MEVEDELGESEYSVDESASSAWILKISKPLSAVLIALLVVAGGGIAVFIFSQSLPNPSVIPTVVSQGSCGGTTSPVPATVITGTAGFVIWNCAGAPPTAAFNVNGAGTVTPTFTLASGFTTLYIYKSSGTPTTACATAASNRLLSSGVAVTFLAADTGGWNYCSDYTSAPSGGFGTPPTSVSWDQ